MPGCRHACDPGKFEILWESRAALGCRAHACGRHTEAASLWRSILAVAECFAEDDPRRAAEQMHRALMCKSNDDARGAKEHARLACDAWRGARRWMVRVDITDGPRTNGLAASKMSNLLDEGLHAALALLATFDSAEDNEQTRPPNSSIAGHEIVSIGLSRFIAERKAMPGSYRRLAAAVYLTPLAHTAR